MIPDEQLNFEACVLSGQVFRFRKTELGWAGVDGDQVIEARRVAGGWEVESRPDPAAWQRFIQIDQDLVEIRKQLCQIEPRLAPILEAMPGLRTLRPACAQEVLFSFLCTPNNHMSRIVRMTEYLASKGSEVEPGHFVFPSLLRLASITETELREHGFGYRAGTIPKVVRELMVKGNSWLDGLKSRDYLEARVELSRLPGIGLKLADCICLFGLHFDRAVPIDTHVWKTCVEWYAPEWAGKSLNPARYERASTLFRDQFGDLAGWAQQYVFYNQYTSYRSGSQLHV